MDDRTAMTKDEALAVAALFADDLARGWIPKRSDIDAALDAVRRAAADGPAVTAPDGPVRPGR